MQAKVTFVKDRLLVENLEKLPYKGVDAVRRATLRTAWRIHNDAKWMCPVDTGRLRASISVNWTDSGMTFGEARGSVNSTARTPRPEPVRTSDGVGQPTREECGEGFYATVGTNVSYAEDVENRSPYLWPAVAMNQGQYKVELEKELKRELGT